MLIIVSGSRITTIFNFGYVSLNIMHLRAEDSGEYTLRAINRWGEIISTSKLNVIRKCYFLFILYFTTF